jgi:hypothetical protein
MVAKTGVYKSMDEQKAQQILDFFERWGTNTEEASEIYKKSNKSAQQFQKEVDNLTKASKKQTASYSDMKKKMQELDDAMEDLSESTDAASAAENQAKKVVLQKMKADLAAEAATKALSEATRKATSEMVGRTVQGTGQFVKSLQNDATGTALATELMVMGIDVAGVAAKGVGKTLNAFGDAAMAAGVATEGLGFVVGGAMKILGTALDAGAETMTKLAKFGVEILSKEVEKSYKAFNQMNSSGALFTDGVEGMRNAANGAGLTVEQMSNVIKVNSSSIAASGLGVTEGTKRIGGAFRAGGDALKTQLFNLGFGVEEQVGLISDVTRQLRITGKTINDKDVAEQTKKYAENLRTIANITGEDAKKKMEAAEADSRELIFRQKVAKAGYDMTEVIAAMAGMSDDQKKNFKDRVASEGAVINEHGAMMNAQVKGFREQGQDLYKSFKDGSLSLDVVKNSNAKYAEMQNKSIMANQALGRAGYFAGEEVGDLTKSMSNLIDFNNKNTKAAADNSIVVGEAAVTQNELTKNLIGAEKATQDLKIGLEKELLPFIKDFVNISKLMLGQVKKMLDDLPKEMTEEEKTRVSEERKKKNAFGQPMATGSDDQVLRNLKRADWLKSQGIKRSQNGVYTGPNGENLGISYENIPNAPKFDKGGTIGAGKIGIAGENGPELIGGPSTVLSTDATKALQNSIGTIQAMMKGLKFHQGEADAFFYSGELGGKGFKREQWAANSGYGGGANGLVQTLEQYLKDVQNTSLPDDQKGTPAIYKQLAENAVQMVLLQKQQDGLPSTSSLPNMNDGNLAFLKDRMKGFEGFNADQLQEEFMKRPEASPIKNAMKQMDDDERNDSAAEAAAHLAEIANLMRQNVDHTARVAANTN